MHFFKSLFQDSTLRLIDCNWNMDDIKIFSKKEEELESLIQTIKIFSEDIGMEFGIENVPCL